MTYSRIPVADGVALNTLVQGSGSPVVLLHGFPQTHLMWRHVAADLAADHTVICPDLRGYGDSDKPDGGYDKRTMAADIVELAGQLGFPRFALAGHDRGALVAFRAGLDHPDKVTHLGILDGMSTYDTWDVLHGVSAAVAFHLYLMAQPPGLPEKLIGGAPDEFFGHFLDAWSQQGFPPDVRAAYLRASRAAVPSIVADFRATATADLAQDTVDFEAGHRFAMPVSVLHQDWGSVLGFDPRARWERWAPQLTYTAVTSGHFMAEEAPAEVIKAIRDLVG
ncbi:alpha/beta fold hydrolase [Kibdelosporangium phytohabitans]|uniref:Alpha/beta hydrolase n=1 Tax=Kibdelosporangium phytohabitans TaxID=860235 RepID=A0A0N9IDX4_9PSEU|nr:alpha/beta hydrolase [Kibdelosporangium phytohabitans]ALG13307.1 alpha/beta hydrolase [Kibdelosporangium phytohabitans]MBE1465085.1 pimeloyl-ACP methyl ester carboxylesterase [Kibdelosporangium phytohabitans]